MKNCRYCGQKIPEYFLEKKAELKSQRIKEARLTRDKWGRPRRTNFSEVRRLRGQGLSIQKLADKFGVSRGAIQYALRGRK